ncbi:MAG: hypothetical protein J6K45_01180 [Clostridia bacterium]|nr:hypothetical protein [Clostridia bacterium]
MKKIFIIITIIVISVISIVFAKYSEYSKKTNEINAINKEFLYYENSQIQINTVVTLMNKAISLNKENNIKQNDKLIFEENDKNSIKIYLETKSTQNEELVQIPMEELMLNKNAGPEKVVYAFSTSKFEMKEKEYHKKTGQIKKIVFSEKIN